MREPPRVKKPFATLRDLRCPICDDSLPRRPGSTRQTCGSWKCRLESKKEEIRREREWCMRKESERRLAQATVLRDTSAAAEGIEDAESYETIVTPSNRRPLRSLPRRRRYRFAKRLMRLVEEALRTRPDTPAADGGNERAPALPILGTACANCLGGCCLSGGTHAYLDEATVRRFVSGHPGASAREVVEAYCRLLPDEAYDDSCVFHAADGCRLPRPMRSATCHKFACGGLSELRLRIELDGDTKFFLAAADDDGVARSRFEHC